MSIDGLARRVMERLRLEGALDYSVAFDDRRYEEVLEAVVATLVGINADGDDKRARSIRLGLPDRAPDFVFWVDHDESGVSVNCLPAQLATVHDWVAVAEWMMHQAAKRVEHPAGYVPWLYRMVANVLAMAVEDGLVVSPRTQEKGE